MIKSRSLSPFSNLIILFLKDFYLECLRSRQKTFHSRNLLCNTYWYIHVVGSWSHMPLGLNRFTINCPFPTIELCCWCFFLHSNIITESSTISRHQRTLECTIASVFFSFFIFFPSNIIFALNWLRPLFSAVVHSDFLAWLTSAILRFFSLAEQFHTQIF